MEYTNMISEAYVQLLVKGIKKTRCFLCKYIEQCKVIMQSKAKTDIGN